MCVKQIKVDRQSVCMGDDVTAPNEKIILVPERSSLVDVIEKVMEYLPKTAHAVWAVDTGREVVAYIGMDEQGIPFPYEFCLENQMFMQTDIQALHCSYFSAKDEKAALLETAKASMRERFQEKLQIAGGSLCIWGEWFGRPCDNFHAVETVVWEKDEIRIQFREGEFLHIQNPKNIRNEEKQLVIGDASRILWVWYVYGKTHTYENMFVRQYTKRADGSVIRAEGKRRDIRDEDGTLFWPLEEIAVCLG